MRRGDAVVIDRHGLTALVESLAARGYRTIGPVVRDGAIALGPLNGVDDLPVGWHDVQAPGSYRLEHTDDPAVFAWAVGPQSVKSEVFPSQAVLWRARHDEAGGTVAVEESTDAAAAVAVVGARPCELAALSVLDRVLDSSASHDPLYRRRRRQSFVVVAECGTPSGTCFCASMGTGPGVEGGFDLALTELVDEAGHRFLMRVGSDRAAEVLEAVVDQVRPRPVDDADVGGRRRTLDGARSHMGRSLDTDDLPELLARNIGHPSWDEVASRCLACGNCTLVCPTCFCSTIEDTSDLGGTVERSRSWASCFDLAHSYINGGPVRQSVGSRYRQWMTHKLSTWWDQFGSSGCVGCGRCITWCPVGIDITEQVVAIRDTDAGSSDASGAPHRRTVVDAAAGTGGA